MRNVTIIIGLAGVLTGCMTAQERMQQLQQEAQQRNAAADDTACKSYGTKPGTQAYTDCRVRLQAARLSAPAAPVVNVNPAPAVAANPFPQPTMPVTCTRLTPITTTCN
jgi:hypothetical protein